MADDSKKDPQSVDDIVDDIVDDMGVEDLTVPKDTKDDAMASLGGVFNIPTSSKRRKKKPAASEASSEKADSDETDSNEAAQESTSKKEKLRKKLKKEDTNPSEKPAAEEPAEEEPVAGEKAARGEAKEIAGIFNPTATDDAAPLDYSSDYLDEDDLGGHPKSGVNMVLVGAVIVLLLILAGVIMQFTTLGEDLALLVRGEYREKKLAAVAQEEADFKAAQLAAMEKFGNLNVTGSPLHSLVKLNGQVEYAPTSSGVWRELRVTSPAGKIFRNLKIKQPHTIELSSPGYKTESIELTEGMWVGTEDSTAYTKQISLNLMPESVQHQAEMEQRMDTSDTDGDYYGTITINTIPAGAEVIFNNKPLLDPKGEALVTPVTFSEYYVRDEKTNKLEKKQINVDTPPDVGHKIELRVPETLGKFVPYATPVQRQMWTCAWKDGQAPDVPARGKKFRDYCDYKFSLEMDFNALNTYIERREAEKARILAENEKNRLEVLKANGQAPEE